MNILVLLG